MREGHNLDLTIRVICPKCDRDLTNEVEYVEACSYQHAPEYWDFLHVDNPDGLCGCFYEVVCPCGVRLVNIGDETGWDVAED
ncbi:MAG: hypothetical protein D6706_02150 [Chloroflexi bacterium]|nr:MAG: hypothetical protein D6706_02150 [Chloroflexota bacterium]